MKINHVAVIGSGIMGSGIAAFFVNQGIPADIYDISMEIVQKNLEKLADPKAKIPLLYTPRFAKKITPRVTPTDIEKHLGKADLIIEVVPEKMELKQQVLQHIDRFRRPDSIVATNTSGLSVNRMSEMVSENMQEYFLGTHYFNPVRFLPLVEIIPGRRTKPEAVEFMRNFLTNAGKKTIICRDTPNFVANRIGVFSLMKALQLMEKFQFDVETVDMITGTPLGNPNSATLRLCDIVGLDTTLHVAHTIYECCPNDEYRSIYEPPQFFKRMVAENMHGEKTRKGFYRKSEKGEILVLNLKTWEYVPLSNPRSDIVKVAKEHHNVEERLRTMVKGDHPINQFCRELLLSTGAYAFNRLGEIADDIATIDNGVKWGFNREVGPIETLDIFGLDKSIAWMQELGITVPAKLKEIADTIGKIYDKNTYPVSCYDMTRKCVRPMEINRNIIMVDALKHSGKTIRENLSARLLDLDDGALLLEIDSRMVPTMNPVDDFVISMMGQAFEVVQEKGFRALVISNQAQNFCAGANIQMLLELCKQKAWDKIDQMSRAFQKANMAMYHAPFPVVVAPHDMTLGGGMEITLAGHKRVAAAELYCGLVEVGVGLLPGGAGNLLLLLQLIESMAARNPGPVVASMRALELIGYAAVSSSAHDAIEKGYLLRDDIIVFDRDEQIKKAKEVALAMTKDFKPKPAKTLLLPGNGAYLVIESTIDEMLKTHNIGPHGAVIAKKIAYVLTGGAKASSVNPVSEEYMLDIEREAFVQLCAEPKSQDRIAYMLKNKKPLLN